MNKIITKKDVEVFNNLAENLTEEQRDAIVAFGANLHNQGYLHAGILMTTLSALFTLYILVDRKIRTDKLN